MLWDGELSHSELLLRTSYACGGGGGGDVKSLVYVSHDDFRNDLENRWSILSDLVAGGFLMVEGLVAKREQWTRNERWREVSHADERFKQEIEIHDRVVCEFNCDDFAESDAHIHAILMAAIIGCDVNIVYWVQLISLVSKTQYILWGSLVNSKYKNKIPCPLLALYRVKLKTNKQKVIQYIQRDISNVQKHKSKDKVILQT